MTAIIAVLGGYRAAAFALVALCAIGFSGWQTIRLERLSGEVARTTLANSKAETKNEKAAREIERARVIKADAIADAYEKGKQDADKAAADTLAGLRAGTTRLRAEWAGCETNLLSRTVAGSIELDAATRAREQGAADLVRLAHDYDERIIALQAIIRADRQLDK